MARSTGSRSGSPVGRLVTVLAAVAALVFAVQGGEYTSMDLVRQRHRADSLRRDIDSLQHDVDSLRALRQALARDPEVQERVARELYGMVRGDREIVYRFIDDSVRDKP